MGEEDDAEYSAGGALARLHDAGFVRDTFATVVSIKGRPVARRPKAQVAQHHDEMAVLQLAVKYDQQDLVEQMIGISRCALSKLESIGGALTVASPVEPGSPEAKQLEAARLLLEEAGSKARAEELERLPMNVQLGVHMLLKIIGTLKVSENTIALRAVLKRLPGLLTELPPLALVENTAIAREVRVCEELRALGLEESEGLNIFEKRKLDIKRRQKREKNAGVTFTANAGISAAVAQVLERAYALQQQQQEQAKQQQHDQQLQNKKKAGAKEGPTDVAAEATETSIGLCSGDLLSAMLGLATKRGSLSSLASCLLLFMWHSQAAERPVADGDESKRAGDLDSESSRVLDGEMQRSILSSQSSEFDLDVEPFLLELASVKPEQFLRAFAQAEESAGGGMLLTWGKGDHGKLGHGRCCEADPNPNPHTHEHCPEGNCTENFKCPKVVSELEFVKIRKVASLSTHSLALTTEGVLYTWGNGDKNRLGHGTTAKEYYPRVVNALRTKPAVKDVSCGLGHTLALLENGHLYAWGNGGNGRLGLGDTDDRALACLVTKFIVDPSDEAYLHEPVKNSTFAMPHGIELAGLYCGASHSMAVCKDGRCFTWGKNNQGQGGHGDVSDKLHPQLVTALCKYKRPDGSTDVDAEADAGTDRADRELDTDWGVKCMAGGWEHTIAVTNDGRIFSFGSGYKDSRRAGLPPVLGHGGTEREVFPRQILALQHETIVYCACGWDHSMAVTAEGQVYAWGAGSNGKLGHGDEESKPLPEMIKYFADKGQFVVQVEAGCEHSVAVTDDGYMYTWGHGDSGRLGHASNRTEKRPKRVEFLAEQELPVLFVAVGDKYNLVLTDAKKDEEMDEDEDDHHDASKALEDASALVEAKIGEEGPASSEANSTEAKVPGPMPQQEKHQQQQQHKLGEAEPGQLLLALPTFQLPGEDDDLVPEWMLSPEHVAVFVIAQIERIATETAARGSGLRKKVVQVSQSPKKLRPSARSVIVPGMLSAWGSQKAAPGSPVAWNRAIESPEATTRTALQGTVDLEPTLLPYCIETTPEAFEHLVALLKHQLKLARNQRERARPCACTSVDEEMVLYCSQCRWTSVWCLLRILKANLKFLPELDSMGKRLDKCMAELHGLLLGIVDSPTPGTTKVAAAAAAAAASPPSNCYAVEALARSKVAFEAAATIQVGFTRFYPTSDSRLGLLRHLLQSTCLSGQSTAVLDVLMSNLARDDAIMPLVVDMTRSRFDILSLLLELLDHVDRPSHRRLLLSFQSHAFTLWKDAEALPGSLRSTLVQYCSEVFRRVLGLLGAGEWRQPEGKEGEQQPRELLPLYLQEVLPSLLCTMIITNPIIDELVEAVMDFASPLLEAMCKSAADPAGRLPHVEVCLRLFARLCGRLLSYGHLRFPSRDLDDAFHTHPILYLCTAAEPSKDSFACQLAVGEDKAVALESRLRKAALASCDVERCAIARGLVSLFLKSHEGPASKQGDALYAGTVELEACPDLVALYAEAHEALNIFLGAVEHAMRPESPVVRQAVLHELEYVLARNAEAFYHHGVRVPADSPTLNALWGPTAHNGGRAAFDEDADATTLLFSALRILRRSRASGFEPLLRLLSKSGLESAVQCVLARERQVVDVERGLRQLRGMVNGIRGAGLTPKSTREVVGELLEYLPYAISDIGSEDLGNPDLVQVRSPQTLEAPCSPSVKLPSALGGQLGVIARPPLLPKLAAERDSLPSQEPLQDLVMGLTVSLVARANPSHIVDMLSDLIGIDETGNAIIATVSLLTNINYLEGGMLDDACAKRLIKALCERLDSFYKDTSDPFGGQASDPAAKTLLYPMHEFLFKALAALTQLVPGPATRAALLAWYRREIASVLEGMAACAKQEAELDALLGARAAYLVPRLTASRIPRKAAPAQAAQQGVMSPRVRSPQSPDGEAAATGPGFQLYMEDDNPGPLAADVPSSNDDLELAVDYMGLGDTKLRCGPLQPPDEISNKCMALSMWLSLDIASSGGEADVAPASWAVVSRCQRRDEEEDGASASSSPLAPTCDAHSLVMYPAVLLRRAADGSLHLDVLVSTIKLSVGVRTTLIEHVSAPVTAAAGEWTHVVIKIDTRSGSEGASSLQLVLDGKVAAEVTLTGQVLRKCSAKVPLRVGGLKGTREFSQTKSHACAGVCSYDLVRKALAQGAPGRVADVMWHTDVLEPEAVKALRGLGRASVRHHRRAALETYGWRAMSLLRELAGKEAPKDSQAESRVLADLALGFFGAARWLEGQRAALLLLEAVRPTLDSEMQDCVNSKLVATATTLASGQSGACRICCDALGTTASCFHASRLTGYEPALRSVLFREHASMLRARTRARAQLAPATAGICNDCAVRSGWSSLARTLAQEHRFSLLAQLVQHLRDLSRSGPLPGVEAVDTVFSLVYGGMLEGVALGTKVILPAAALPRRTEHLTHACAEEEPMVATVTGLFDAGRLLRTYCIQQHHQYLACHSAVFSSQSELMLYDFLVSEEAALAALHVAKAQGCLSAPEPSSPHSPTSPGARHPSDGKGGSVWAVQGSRLVRSTMLLDEPDKQALLTVDFDTFCCRLSADASGQPDQAAAAAAAAQQQQQLQRLAPANEKQNGPKAWALGKVACLRREEHVPQLWAPCMDLCAISEWRTQDAPRPVLSDTGRDKIIAQAASAMKVLFEAEACAVNTQAEAVRRSWARRSLSALLMQLMTSKDETLHSAAMEALLVPLRDAALSDKSVVCKNVLQQLGVKLGRSKSVRVLLKLVSSSAQLSSRALEVGAERAWERVEADMSSPSEGPSPSLGGDNKPLRQAFRSLAASRGNRRATGGASRPQQQCELESMGGELQIEETSYRVQSVGMFSSVRLRGNTDFGLLELREGKWYYEVVLMTDERMQIGWADTAFRGDPGESRGVGDDSHSWAFDGYRGKKCNGESQPYGLETPWQVGDVVGCQLDLDEGTVAFSLNGHSLGIAFDNLASAQGGLYPAVSLGMGQSARFVFSSFNHEPPAGFRSALESFEQVKDEEGKSGGIADDEHKASESKDEGSLGLGEQEQAVADEADEDEEDDLVDQQQAEDDLLAKRQRIVDALLATGLPIDWCRRAVEHVARASAEVGSAFDENAAITWVMEEMMKEDSQALLIQSMNAAADGAHISDGAGAIDGQAVMPDTGHASDIQRMLLGESNEGIFTMTRPGETRPPISGGPSVSALLGAATPASEVLRSRLHALGESTSTTPALSFSPTMLGSEAEGPGRREIALLDLVESSRHEDVLVVACVLNTAVAIEHSRSCLVALLQSMSQQAKASADVTAAPLLAAVRENLGGAQLQDLLKVVLSRGPTSFDLHAPVTTAPVLGVANHSEAVLREALTLLAQSALRRKEPLPKELMEGAMVHFQQSSTRPFDSVPWGSDGVARIKGGQAGTSISRMLAAPPAGNDSFAPAWRSLAHAGHLVLGSAANAFAGPPHLALTDADALTLPNLEWAALVMRAVLDATETAGEGQTTLDVVTPEMFDTLVKAAFSPNLALKDAVFRLCARVLDRMRSELALDPSKASKAAALLAAVPEQLIMRLFTQRLRKERPYTTRATAFTRSLAAFGVALRRLHELLESGDRGNDVAGAGDAPADEAMKLYISGVSSDSITLKWRAKEIPAGPAAAIAGDIDAAQHDLRGNEGVLESARPDVVLGLDEGFGAAAGHDEHGVDVHGQHEDEDEDEGAVEGLLHLSRPRGLDPPVLRRRSSSRSGSGTEGCRDDELSLDDGSMPSGFNSARRRSGQHSRRSSRPPCDVVLIEFALGAAADFPKGAEAAFEHYDRYDLASAPQGAWRRLAEIPLDSGTNEYACHGLAADTPYRFRMGIRRQAIEAEGGETTSWGPVRSANTAPKTMLRLSTFAIGANLVLSNNGLTVRNKVNKKWNAARATRGFSKGVHRWSVRIDRCISKNIFIGVMTSGGAVNNYVGSDRHGWGFLANKAVWHNKAKARSYGELYREGDVVGVVLDCNAATISFSRNGSSFGIAAEGLDSFTELYPAVSLYNKDDQVTIFMEEEEEGDTEEASDDAAASEAFKGTAYATCELGRGAEAAAILECLQRRDEPGAAEAPPLPRRTVQRVAALHDVWARQGQLMPGGRKVKLMADDMNVPAAIRQDLIPASPWGAMGSDFDHVLTTNGTGKLLGISSSGQLVHLVPEQAEGAVLEAALDTDASAMLPHSLDLWGGQHAALASFWDSNSCSLIRGEPDPEELDEDGDGLVPLRPAVAPFAAEDGDERVVQSQSQSFSISDGDTKKLPRSMTMEPTTGGGGGGGGNAKASATQPATPAAATLIAETDLDALASRLESFTPAADRQIIAHLDMLCRRHGKGIQMLPFDAITAPLAREAPALAGIPLDRLRERAVLLVHLNLLVRGSLHFLELASPSSERRAPTSVRPPAEQQRRQNARSSSMAWSPGQLVLGSLDLLLLETKAASLTCGRGEGRVFEEGSVRIAEQVLALESFSGHFEVVTRDNRHLEGRNAIHRIVQQVFCEALEAGVVVRGAAKKSEGGAIIEPGDNDLLRALGRVMGLALLHSVKIPEHCRLEPRILETLCGLRAAHGLSHLAYGVDEALQGHGLAILAGPKDLDRLLSH